MTSEQRRRWVRVKNEFDAAMRLALFISLAAFWAAVVILAVRTAT